MVAPLKQKFTMTKGQQDSVVVPQHTWDNPGRAVLGMDMPQRGPQQAQASQQPKASYLSCPNTDLKHAAEYTEGYL